MTLLYDKYDEEDAILNEKIMNLPTLCYKIVDIEETIDVFYPPLYKFLYHGVNGTRVIPFNTWLKADRKWAGEGGTKYWTGFHVFLDKTMMETYLKKFTDKTKKRVVVKCYAKNLRLKESSRRKVFLAEWLMFPSKQQI